MHETASEHILERLLEANEELAQHNKDHFEESGTYTVNLMSAPGAGKTSLIEATISHLRHKYNSVVIEGDMAGDLDVQRLADQGIEAHQITTGRSCHLDSGMIARFLHDTDIGSPQLLLIENVGNLVCPADFPLGEHLRVVLLSVTEGDDKPFKYPVIFRKCDAVIFTKCDLLPHVKFNFHRAEAFIQALNPEAQIFRLSVKSGVGLKEWLMWLRQRIEQYSQSRQKNSQDENVHLFAG